LIPIATMPLDLPRSSRVSPRIRSPLRHVRVWQLVALLMLPTLAGAQLAPSDIRGFLATPIGLGADELRAIDRGDPVTRVLPTKDDRVVAIFGVIVIAASREAVVSSL